MKPENTNGRYKHTSLKIFGLRHLGIRPTKTKRQNSFINLFHIRNTRGSETYEQYPQNTIEKNH